DLRSAEATVHASRFSCLNLGGIGWDGRPFSKAVHVALGDVQAMCCGVEIPQDAAAGTYSAGVIVGAGGRQTQAARLAITVAGAPIDSAGDDEPWRLSRLRWLDSTKGSEDEVVPPFTPVVMEGHRLRILGREVALSRRGLPSRLTSYFAPEVTGIREAGRELLAGAMRFLVTPADGAVVECSPDGTLDVQGGGARATWHTCGTAATLEVTVRGEIEFDGNMELSVRVRAREETTVRDLALHVPFRSDAVPYMTGLGRKGGARPEVLSWHWDTAKNQDSFWLGDANVGAQITLKDESYSRPLNTNFYHLKPLVLPDSWHNAGAGGIRMGPPDGEVFPVVCFSGPRTLADDEELVFQFRLMLTPFKPLDTRAHFQTRFYHASVAPAEAVAEGANTINIHHARELNPYINYPFFRTEALREYVERAHALGCRVKLYYTVRELTTRAPELFGLMSLGDEVFVDGPGGGHAWLMEHLEDHYIAAWHAAGVRDTSVINGVLSRWHNHYVEGLDWLARRVGIDGVYIDDLGFGREIMQRVRRVLTRHRPDPNIDLHSANQFNEKDGFASSANLYMEHFPYIDRLWFGEYFDYDEPPEYWLVEVSGIPFGLMSEMLQDGGNPWRGMLFGMTGRMPRVALNKALWAFWDEYGLPDSGMIGWWSDACPARTADSKVRCTVYASDRRAIIAVASWHNEAVAVALDLDWTRLRMDASRATLHAPGIPGFQEERSFAPSEPIPIEAGRGWLLVLEEGR
ncbi:MAG: glycoside hydrolase domain-containing protein, partial [Phycisphaerae bacterium]